MYKDKNKAHIKNQKEYLRLYQKSIENSDLFWEDKGKNIDWYKKWDIVSDVDYSKAKINWFKGGKLNVTYNCLDRHIEKGNGQKCALIWEGNDPKSDKSYT